MAARESDAQKVTVERVMHEFKHGELRSAAGGGKVKNRKQAIAIALSEAGASKRESARTNAHNLRRTKAKEARGETAEAEVEGKTRPQDMSACALAPPRSRACVASERARRKIRFPRRS